MGTWTKVVEKTIVEEVLSSEECLTYLKEGIESKALNTFSSQLKNTMKELGYGETTESLIDVLIMAWEKKIGEVTKSQKQNIKKWLLGDAFPERQNAIKICFALEFSTEQATDLLRKGCRLSNFYFRDAREVIYYYCLQNKKTYGEAEKLIEEYIKCKACSSDIDIDQTIYSTQVLRSVFTENPWKENEKEFLKALCARRKSFDRYSRTATEKYNFYKASLRIKIIEMNLSDIEILSLTNENEISVVKNFKKELCELSKVMAQSDETFVMLISGKESLKKKWEAVKKKALENQKSITEIVNLEKIVPDDILYKEIFYGIPYLWSKETEEESKAITEEESKATAEEGSETTAEEESKATAEEESKAIAEEESKATTGDNPGKQTKSSNTVKKVSTFKSLRHSILQEKKLQVLDGFPNIDNLERMTKINNLDKQRKAMILIYFVDYVYERMCGNLSKHFEKSYYEFYQKLSELLNDCGMPFLYLRDPFDWLVMKSVFLLDEINSEEDENPVEFLNEVLRLSFDLVKIPTN